MNRGRLGLACLVGIATDLVLATIWAFAIAVLARSVGYAVIGIVAPVVSVAIAVVAVLAAVLFHGRPHEVAIASRWWHWLLVALPVLLVPFALDAAGRALSGLWAGSWLGVAGFRILLGCAVAVGVGVLRAAVARDALPQPAGPGRQAH